jgi:AcrR family transcriptional regulator
VPKRVDHVARRREIADAVCRITVKGGLQAATFREIAAEAGVSVRLVQYYFGTKAELMLATQRHVAQRAAARAFGRLRPGATPRSELRTILGSFIPVDDESRENMLVFVALHTAALVEPSLARTETAEVPNAMHSAVRKRLAAARVRRGVDAALEASILVSIVPSLAQAVLDGTQTPRQARKVLDYAIDRALG